MAHRIIDNGAFTCDKAELESHRLDREQQVGEDDGGVHVQDLDRLQGHGGRQVWPLAHFQHAVLGTDLAILFQVPAGLTHEPDGSDVRRPPAARVQKTAIH